LNPSLSAFKVCDFLVPHGLGIQEVTCFIQRDEHGRLFLRPAAAMEASVSVASSTSDTEDEEEWQPPMKGALVACIEAGNDEEFRQIDYLLFVECFFFPRSLCCAGEWTEVTRP